MHKPALPVDTNPFELRDRCTDPTQLLSAQAQARGRYVRSSPLNVIGVGHSTDLKIVFEAPVSARQPNRLAQPCSELFQTGDQVRVQLNRLATGTSKLVKTEMLRDFDPVQQICHRTVPLIDSIGREFTLLPSQRQFPLLSLNVAV